MRKAFRNSSVKHLALLAAVLGTVGCDHITKQVATTMLAGGPVRTYLGGTLRLAYVENPGGFLSLGDNLPPAARTAVFTVATGLVLLVLTWFVIRRAAEGAPIAGLALFIAGSASNWIDRVARGTVVDFLNLGVGSLRTGVFNLADVAIMIGAGMFVIAEFRKHSQ